LENEFSILFPDSSPVVVAFLPPRVDWRNLHFLSEASTDSIDSLSPDLDGTQALLISPRGFAFFDGKVPRSIPLLVFLHVVLFREVGALLPVIESRIIQQILQSSFPKCSP
jgi:hypothetical protein